MNTEQKKKQADIIICMWAADLTLLPFLGKDVTDQRLLKNFLFDQEVPKTSGWKRLSVLCPEKKCMDKNKLVTYMRTSTNGSLQ